MKCQEGQIDEEQQRAVADPRSRLERHPDAPDRTHPGDKQALPDNGGYQHETRAASFARHARRGCNRR